MGYNPRPLRWFAFTRALEIHGIPSQQLAFTYQGERIKGSGAYHATLERDGADRRLPVQRSRQRHHRRDHLCGRRLQYHVAGHDRSLIQTFLSK